MIPLSTQLNPLVRAATFSKGPEFWSGDPAWQPKAIYGGFGAQVQGCNGWYTDFVSGLGAVILGYPTELDETSPANQWANRVAWQVQRGVGFSLPHPLEQQVAEKLVTMLGGHVPGWSPEGLCVRFGLTGSDACSMAVRLARAVTGRRHIISIGFHGWGAEFVAATPPAWGVTPQPVSTVPFGDLAALEGEVCTHQDASWKQIRHDLAAIIIEQPPQEPPAGYWRSVRQLCNRTGALLILDEVVTGLRFGLGGAAEYYGIEPDIMALGKALGNGVPISAMVFRKEYGDWFTRNDPCFVSSTGFGNIVSLSAAAIVLDVWGQPQVDHIWHIGGALIDGLRAAGYDVIGQPPRSLLQFPTPAERGYFIKAMAERGILLNRPNFPTLAHTEADVAETILAARSVKAEMATVDVEAVMAGKLPAQLFSNR